MDKWDEEQGLLCLGEAHECNWMCHSSLLIGEQGVIEEKLIELANPLRFT